MSLVVTAFLLGGVLFTGCKDDETSDALDLYYSEVVNIGPSMLFNSDAPTYYGPAPSDFAITGITLDDAAVSSESFSINAVYRLHYEYGDAGTGRL